MRWAVGLRAPTGRRTDRDAVRYGGWCRPLSAQGPAPSAGAGPVLAPPAVEANVSWADKLPSSRGLREDVAHAVDLGFGHGRRHR